MRMSDWSSDVCSSDLDFTGRAFGRIKTFNQELRLSLDTDRFRGLIGANYDYANVDDRHQYRIFDASASTPFPDLPPISAAISQALQKTRTYAVRSEEHTSELQSLMRISYAVFCLKKKKTKTNNNKNIYDQLKPNHI